MRKENKSAIEAIIDRVRDLAELYSSGASSGTNTLSPMEKSKFLTWASDVEKIVYDFEPSDNHSRDPIVCMLGKLQFLQDCHVCLAEVAVDARSLLERWERVGVFDSSGSSGEEGESDSSHADREDHGQGKTVWEHEDNRYPQPSHAYESVRQRAAANVIKRNVVLYARSQPAFRDRVEELHYFGRTTHALMKELSSSANMRRPAHPSSDIFDLVKVKRDVMYAHSIGFSELMRFSKHMAVFPVDQAIRTVEDLEMKRYLFQTRCALKLQTIWRKARAEFQGRRMVKVVEALRVQREREEREEQERLRLMSKGSTPDPSEGKRKSVLSFRKNRASVSTSSSSPSSSRTSSRGDEQPDSKQASSTPLGRIRTSVAVVKRKESTTPPNSSELQDRKKRNSRVRNADSRERTVSDDDVDTRDVETAWQSFLDSTTVDESAVVIPVTEHSAPMPETEGQQPEDLIPVVQMPLTMDDDWKNWSDGDESVACRTDDEADLEAEDKIASRLTVAAANATLPLPPESCPVSADRDSMGASGSRDEGNRSATPQSDARRSISSYDAYSLIRPDEERPSSPAYAFLIDHEQKRRANKIRVGNVSAMVPFAESVAKQEEQQGKPAVGRSAPKATRKHLQDMDFGAVGSDVALLQRVDPLIEAEVGESVKDIPQPHESTKNVPVRQKSSVRKKRLDLIKHSIAVRDTEISTYPVTRHQRVKEVVNDKDTARAAIGKEGEQVGRFIYPIQSESLGLYFYICDRVNSPTLFVFLANRTGYSKRIGDAKSTTNHCRRSNWYLGFAGHSPGDQQENNEEIWDTD